MPFWLDISKIPSCLDSSKKNKKEHIISSCIHRIFTHTQILFYCSTSRSVHTNSGVKKLISKLQHNYLEINCENTVYF